MQKPFESLDLSSDYIVHDVTLFAHNHPTQPDKINAAVKAIETALKAFDLDAFALGGDSIGGSILVTSSRALLAEECAGHLILAQGVLTLSLPSVVGLPDNARVDIVNIGTYQMVTIAPAASDRIVTQGEITADGQAIMHNSIGASISLRKDVDGWVAVGATPYNTTGK